MPSSAPRWAACSDGATLQEGASGADAVGDTDEGYPTRITITLHDGSMTGGCFERGTYTVAGDRITFHSSEYSTDSTVTFKRADNGDLTLTPVPPMDLGDAFVCFYQPWEKDAS